MPNHWIFSYTDTIGATGGAGTVYRSPCTRVQHPVPDLPIDLWSQYLGALRPKCIISLTLLLDFQTYAVIPYFTF